MYRIVINAAKQGGEDEEMSLTRRNADAKAKVQPRPEESKMHIVCKIDTSDLKKKKRVRGAHPGGDRKLWMLYKDLYHGSKSSSMPRDVKRKLWWMADVKEDEDDEEYDEVDFLPSMVPRYAATGRPVTRYGFYPDCDPEDPNEPTDGHVYLPVVRYEGHAKNQRAADVNTDDMCGRYFFWEPNSPVLMDMGKCLVFPGKIAAYVMLTAMKRGEPMEAVFGPDLFERYHSSIGKAIAESVGNREGVSAEIARRAGENADMVINFRFVNGSDDIQTTENPIPGFGYLTTASPSIGGNYRYLKSNNDWCDRHICMMARDMGYDTLVLQHEPGETRVCTEIVALQPYPYDRLVLAPELEGKVEGDVKKAFSRRMRMHGLQNYMKKSIGDGSDHTLCTMWMPDEDGVLYGEGLRLVRPVFDLERRIVGLEPDFPTQTQHRKSK